MVLDLFGGTGVSEVELVRETGDCLDEFLQRSIFFPGREEAGAQAMIHFKSVC